METISHWLLTFLLNSLWQIPLVTAVAAVACRLMRRGPAAYRHALWAAALAAAVLLPLASVQTGRQAESTPLTVANVPQPIEITPPATALSVAAPARSASAPNARTVPFGQTTATVVLSVYLLVLLLGLGKLAWAWIRTVQLRRSAETREAPPLLREVWARCRESFGLDEVELLSSSEVSVPVTAGLWRGAIILPESLLSETSKNLLTTAIGHEMAHVARRDFAQKLLYELLSVPIWFHPASWLIRRGLERTREMACDELVTRRLLAPDVYARSMVRIAVAMAGRPNPGYTLGVFGGDVLEERIRRLLEQPVIDWKRARLLLATGLSAIVLCAVFASGLAVTARAQSSSRDEMKLAAAAYNAGDFRAAVQRFQSAVDLEPANLEARLFLANALLSEHLAEKGGPDSTLLRSARQQYQDVLVRNPHSKQAMQGMMATSIYGSQLSEAYDWALKLVQLDSQDKTAYYAAGMLDWAMVYPEVERARQAGGMNTTGSLIPDPGVRKNLRDRLLPRIEDGLRMLQTALKLDPDYSAALSYVNLLNRVKAGIAESAAESADLMSKANTSAGQAFAARQRQGQSSPPRSPHLDIDGPAPGPPSAQAFAAPPPPPPPPPPPAGWMESAGNKLVSETPLPMTRSHSVSWQVAGGSNVTADSLVRSLKGKGFPARLVLSGDGSVHVIAGPYDDTQSLEQAKVNLEAAGFRTIGKR